MAEKSRRRRDFGAAAPQTEGAGLASETEPQNRQEEESGPPKATLAPEIEPQEMPEPGARPNRAPGRQETMESREADS